MSIRTSQNPGLAGLDELTALEEAFVQNLTYLSYEEGDILYYDGTRLNRIAIGSNGQTLLVSGGLPSWGTAGSGDYFEKVSKNIKSWDATLTYIGDNLTSISYTNSTDTILKTLTYSGDQLISIVLSGDTPTGIDLTKTLTYTGDNLTGIIYS